MSKESERRISKRRLLRPFNQNERRALRNLRKDVRAGRRNEGTDSAEETTSLAYELMRNPKATIINLHDALDTRVMADTRKKQIFPNNYVSYELIVPTDEHTRLYIRRLVLGRVRMMTVKVFVGEEVNNSFRGRPTEEFAIDAQGTFKQSTFKYVPVPSLVLSFVTGEFNPKRPSLDQKTQEGFTHFNEVISPFLNS